VVDVGNHSAGVAPEVVMVVQGILKLADASQSEFSNCAHLLKDFKVPIDRATAD
jgi:hypothetical protein